MVLKRLLHVAALLFVMTFGGTALAATYTVDNTADSGTNSLRDAITNANSNPGSDTIFFGIAGVGPHVIEIATPLPDITELLIINGMSQGGSSPNTLAVGNDAIMMIVIRPSVGSTATNGLLFTEAADNSIIRGLVLQGFSSNALVLSGADGVTVVGNFIGTNAAGTAASANAAGILAYNGCAGLIIGSTLAADRNVMSGNNNGAVILGDPGTTADIRNNYIGTNAAGTAAIANNGGIRVISADIVNIGDETAGAGNVISGNNAGAVSIASATNQVFVEGNLIGVGADGTTSIPNSEGILVYQTSGFAPNFVRIGGATSAFYNTIANNTGDGIAVFATAPAPQGVQVAGNRIYGNGDLGIDLTADGVTANDIGDGDTGPNTLQNFPVITSATFNGGNITINGTLNSFAGGSFDLRFHQSTACDASGFGEGETYLGLSSVTTDGSGDATFSVTLPGTSGGVVTATATNNATAGTSEFSECQSVVTAATPSITIDDPSVAEGNAATTTLTFTVTLSVASASDVTVDWTTQTDSADGTDFAGDSGTLTILAGATTGTIDVLVNGDVSVEPNETFFLNLSNPTNATISDAQGIGTIQNDDALPTVAITDVNLSEGNGGGTTAFTFTVTLSAAALSTSSVDWATADNSANAGSDFTGASGTLTFNTGDQSQTFTIDVNADAMYETGEDFLVNFSNPSNIDLTDTQAIGNIGNDDGEPAVTIEDETQAEGDLGSASMIFTVTLSNPSQAPVIVFFNSADVSANDPGDYNGNSGSVTVLSGQLTATFGVTVLGDTNIESDETFVINLTSATGATIADNQATGTITNDDGLVTPSITISDPTVTEGNALTTTLTYIVTLSSASASPVSVTWTTADGSGTVGNNDYAPATNVLVIPSGSTSGQIDVTVNGDTDIEANETVLVNLTAPVNATLSETQGVGTIANDDGLATPGISIGDISLAEGDGGSTLFTFTISLSQASASDVSVTATTDDGTATAGAFSDYQFQTNTVTILSGNTTGTFTVAVNGDVNVEGDETFVVDLTSPVNGSILDAQATATIQNDDSFGTTTLTILKTAPAAVAAGANIVCTIVVSNSGAIPATNVVVTDSIPATTAYVSANATQGSCVGTTTVVCTLGTIANGSSATITLTVQAPSVPANVTNTASVDADQTSTAPGSSSASTAVAAAAVSAIPTLSEWMLLALAMVLAAAALLKMR